MLFVYAFITFGFTLPGKGTLIFYFLSNFTLIFILSTCTHLLLYLLQSSHETAADNKNSRLFFALYFFVAGVTLSGTMFQKVINQTPIDNFNILDLKYQNMGKVEILYFNDKYIFLQTDCNKKMKKIHIEPIESILKL